MKKKQIVFEVQRYLSEIINTKTSSPIHAMGRVEHEIYHRYEDVRLFLINMLKVGRG